MVFSASAMLTVHISRFLRTVQALTISPSGLLSEIWPDRRKVSDGSPLTKNSKSFAPRSSGWPRSGMVYRRLADTRQSDHPQDATIHEEAADNYRRNHVAGFVQILVQSLELGGSKLYACAHGGDIDTDQTAPRPKRGVCGPVVVMGSFFATMMLQICSAVIMASSLVCRGSCHAVSDLIGEFLIIAKLERSRRSVELKIDHPGGEGAAIGTAVARWAPALRIAITRPSSSAWPQDPVAPAAVTALRLLGRSQAARPWRMVSQCHGVRSGLAGPGEGSAPGSIGWVRKESGAPEVCCRGGAI